jgi:membrane dipeptidase
MQSSQLFLIDAHLDIAYNALEWERDIRASVIQTREREAQDHQDYQHPDAAGGITMVGLPELRQAGFGIIFSTLMAFPWESASQEVGSQYTQTQTYSSRDEASRVAHQQLAYYQQLARERGISLIQAQSDLLSLLAQWQQASPQDEHRPVGLVLLMEGADPIRTPGEAEKWWLAGVRLVGLAWNTGSWYAGGNVTGGPLTQAGRELLAHMQRLGMALDTSHLSEESFWQAMESFQGPVLASHSNCRALVPRTRELSDEMIRAIVERNGVVGISPANFFLVPGWSRNRKPVSLQQMVAHIDHVCQLARDAHHVGIGSDLDGGFGRNEVPTELETIGDLLLLGDLLRGAGYSPDDVGDIMGGNWLRFLKRVLP